jgi:pimeloyl-ACP methyl ester carboxylesterase
VPTRRLANEGDVTEHVLRVDDGRMLEVVESGDPKGSAVLVLHGTPGSGGFYAPHVEDARTRGVRLLGYSRPGYGRSTAQPGRRVAGAAADVVAIADALDIERLVVWGISGGAPHALACAALAADRVVAAAALASPAPRNAPGLDWRAGMGEMNSVEFAKAEQGRSALEPFVRDVAGGLVAADPQELAVELRSLLAPPDAAALTGEFAAFLSRAMRRGLARSLEGWIDDDLAFVTPWGFELSEIAAPVLLWHGEHDRFVPPAHARWLVDQIPGVDARISADDGHVTLTARRIPEVHGWLLAAHGRSSDGATEGHARRFYTGPQAPYEGARRH